MRTRPADPRIVPLVLGSVHVGGLVLGRRRTRSGRTRRGVGIGPFAAAELALPPDVLLADDVFGAVFRFQWFARVQARVRLVVARFILRRAFGHGSRVPPVPSDETVPASARDPAGTPARMSLVPVPDLRYVTDNEPGLHRRRAGRSFRVLAADGTPVREAAVLERVRALAIPPAWTDVWICASADGHLQATGRDARGRKQYRYHPTWRAFRDRVKFSKLAQFGTALPTVRRQVDRDLRHAELTRERVLATVVWLLERTLVRVGNEEYAQANNSYGLTTLRNRHAKPVPGGVRLVFRGKSGRAHEVDLTDRRITRVVRECHELPGALLFEYVDADGGCRPVQSNDVNDYLRAASGMDATAKDFRTWRATCLAASLLADMPAPATERAAQSGMKEVATIVSETLRNTPAVARASYIHPMIVDRYIDGTLMERWPSTAPRAPRGLDADERRLLALLRSSRRAAPAEPPAVQAKAS